MDKIEYYNQFEDKVKETLLKLCKDRGYIGEHLLTVEELDEKWHEMAPEYMVNAVPEIAKYPKVAIAWAAYLGMGMATVWDGDWETYSKKDDLYESFVKPRGFDNMDDYVMEDLMGISISSKEYRDIASFYQDLSETAITLIRKENIEPQSIDAFQIYARTVKILYKTGVSVALKMLGYKYEKMTMPEA
ncbi:MAG: hypothetical protein Q4F97_09530 [Bacteroidales bacterium]|nr:hypothetical protein [Bacteroidales bacterium]